MLNLDVGDADIDEFLREYNAVERMSEKQLEFDAPRRAALKSWDDVQACPGSGKTTLVAAKLLILSKKWAFNHRGICVLTHTNVACDEIRERLRDHPSGYSLTFYPHFIGTIQEFVNKHVAMPYLRGSYKFRRFVEDNEGRLEVMRVQMDGCKVDDICRNLYRTCNAASFADIRGYLGSLHLVNADGDLRFYKQNGAAQDSRAGGNSPRWQMLSQLKGALFESGIFNYRDMYAFAETLLSDNEDILPTLRARFPIVFVDEMQDTQSFQDLLINTIFGDESVKLQRFGDPDQAIFDNMGGEAPNDSFNSNQALQPVNSTHRFGQDIASKIYGLSVTQIGEALSFRPVPEAPVPHTIFIYNDASKPGVLERYSQLVDLCDPGRYWSTVKAVGATEGQGGFISEYWSNYDRRKSVKRPRPEKLIHLVRREWWKHESHTSSQYSLLVQAVIDALRISGIRDERFDPPRYFSVNTLASWLKETERHTPFRKLLTSWICSPAPDGATWAAQMGKLGTLLGIDPADQAVISFLAFEEPPNAVREDVGHVGNIFTAASGREVEVATIHSVKGETHDATLVLETKNRYFDLQRLLNHMALSDDSEISAVTNRKFARQLYVATSRPRHLLCLAIHEDHIDELQRTALGNAGWNLFCIPTGIIELEDC